MTILAFALADDHVLIAADIAMIQSSLTDPPQGYPPASVVTLHKLRRVGEAPLAWALTGDASEIRRFGQWVKTAELTDWDQFAEAAGVEMRRLNELALQRGHQARKKKADVIQSSVLMCGYLGDRLDAVILEPDGNPLVASSISASHGAVGIFGPMFGTAWEAARALVPDAALADPGTMSRFMDALCASIPGLGAPVDVWMITSTKCEAFDPGGAQ